MLSNKFLIGNVFCLLAISFLTGCSKSFIDRDPIDAIASSESIKTTSALQNALTGTYSELRSTNLYGRTIPVIADLLADNTFLQIGNSGRYTTIYPYTFINSDGNFSGIWNDAYTTILRANNIIHATPSGDAGTISNLQSQAYAIRALMYFELANIFARNYDDTTLLGVPIVLSDDFTIKPKRNTIGEVYGQIQSDLATALSTAPNYSSSITISKYAIEALQAKVFLYSKQYDKALAAAKDVIDNSGFSLAANETSFSAFWNNAAAKSDQLEVLFEVDADAANNNGFDDLGAIYNNGYKDIYCDSTFYSTYSATDIRRDLILNGTTKNGARAYVVNKYPNGSNTDKDNIKVIRLAEVYLIAAESAAMLSQTTTSLTYLNTLAQRRDPQLIAYNLSGNTLIDTIISQRRKELAFEGDRFYDLNRLGKTINRYLNTGGVSVVSSYLNISYSDFRRIAPIPLTEIQANPNLASEQNPSY